MLTIQDVIKVVHEIDPTRNVEGYIQDRADDGMEELTPHEVMVAFIQYFISEAEDRAQQQQTETT
jgi:hypothetical protein